MFRPTLLAAALAFAAAPAHAQNTSLEGDWMALGDMLGLVPGNIEAMEIAGDQLSAQLWTQCTPPECADPQASAEGQIRVDATTLQVEGTASYPTDPGWAYLQLPGGAWSIIAQGRRLITMREATVNQQSVPLMRLWLQVAPEVPQQLADYLAAAQRDPAQALCAIVSLHGAEGEWPAFAAHLSALAAPMHDLARGTPQADPAAYGPEADAALQQLAHYVRSEDLPEGTVLVPEILYPLPEALAAEIADCNARLHGSGQGG
ncbi:hypothetical protein LCM17_02375 [Cereibacter sphaeroides]|nr:hypothetical protein [Cereibacter sphaeroides]